MAIKYMCDLCGKELEEKNYGWTSIYSDTDEARAKIKITVSSQVVKLFGTKESISEPLCCFDCTKRIIMEGKYLR